VAGAMMAPHLYLEYWLLEMERFETIDYAFGDKISIRSRDTDILAHLHTIHS
jgi:hypothetical protein